MEPKDIFEVKLKAYKKGKEESREDGVLTVLKNLIKKEFSDSYILEITGISSELLTKAKQSLN